MSNKKLDWLKNLLIVKNLQFSSNQADLTKMTSSKIDTFGRISAGLEENCRFFLLIAHFLASPMVIPYQFYLILVQANVAMYLRKILQTYYTL